MRKRKVVTASRSSSPVAINRSGFKPAPPLEATATTATTASTTIATPHPTAAHLGRASQAQVEDGHSLPQLGPVPINRPMIKPAAPWELLPLLLYCSYHHYNFYPTTAHLGRARQAQEEGGHSVPQLRPRPHQKVRDRSSGRCTGLGPVGCTHAQVAQQGQGSRHARVRVLPHGIHHKPHHRASPSGSVSCRATPPRRAARPHSPACRLAPCHGPPCSCCGRGLGALAHQIGGKALEDCGGSCRDRTVAV